MPRRIVTFDDFDRAAAELAVPAADRMLSALIQSIAADPYRFPTLAGLTVRVLRSRSYGPYPALRIFYTFDEEAVYLLHVEMYDELQP